MSSHLDKRAVRFYRLRNRDRQGAVFKAKYFKEGAGWIIKITVCRRISINKIDLIIALANETDLTKSEAEAVVNLFFNEMANALAKGDRVEIRGLCSFYVKQYKAYTGRNPKTGEPIRVESKKLPFFKVGKELKERVDNQN